MERFIKWHVVALFSDASNKAIAQALIQHWVVKFGCPAIVFNAPGSNFEDALKGPSLWAHKILALGNQPRQLSIGSIQVLISTSLIWISILTPVTETSFFR